MKGQLTCTIPTTKGRNLHKVPENQFHDLITFLGPSMVLIRSSMCNEICLHGFIPKQLTDFAQSGLKMTAMT